MSKHQVANIKAVQLFCQFVHNGLNLALPSSSSCEDMCVSSVCLTITTSGRSGLAVACLIAVREVLGLNCAVGSCVYRTTTAIYSCVHPSCSA